MTSRDRQCQKAEDPTSRVGVISMSTLSLLSRQVPGGQKRKGRELNRPGNLGGPTS
jgi:hypothetical protein